MLRHGPQKTQPPVLKPSSSKKRWSRDDIELGLLGLPSFLWYAVFCYLPMFGLIIAFKNYRVFPKQSFIFNLLSSDWVGFDNFTFFIKDNSFGMLLRNTLLYNIVFILLGILIPVSLAIMINEIYSKRKSKVYQTMMFFPHFLSWVVVSYFVFAFLNPTRGLLNTIIQAFGAEKITWYSKPQYWPFILTIMQLWKTVGYSMVVYLASITGIDHTLYEAAMLDGASKWQQAKFVTLPMMKTILIVMFILNVGRIFYTDFGLFYQVTQGVPNSLYKVASTFDTYVYMALQSNAPIGKTAAASMFQSVCCCVTVLVANAIVRKVDPDSAII